MTGNFLSSFFEAGDILNAALHLLLRTTIIFFKISVNIQILKCGQFGKKGGQDTNCIKLKNETLAMDKVRI